MAPVTIAAAFVAACSTASPAHPTAHVVALEPAATVPFQLYTHCGIHETMVDSGYYDAVTPLDDGAGNPPVGWGNPYQDGAMARVSTAEVVFTDDLGHRVVFRLRPGARGFRRLCA